MTGTKSSNSENRLRALIRVAIGVFLIAPYLIWLLWLQAWSWPPFSEWRAPLETAFLQAAFSAALAMAVGFVLFGAAQAWRSTSARRASEFALLLPNMIPPLFLVLAFLSWVTPFMAFPFGLGAVIAAHVVLNAGLVAVSVDRLMQDKMGGITEAAWVMGISRWTFWRRILIPFLKADLACVFLFIFSLCFTSFSIPLVLGGEKLTTLEVAIFDTIRMEGRWDKAVILAACQSLMLLVLAWILPRPFWPGRPIRRPLSYLAFPSLRLLVYLPAVFLISGWAFGLIGGMKTGLGVELPVFEAWMTTVALGIGVGALHLILFLLTAYVLPHDGLDRFLNGYLAPSPAVTGFALLLLPLEGDVLEFVKIVLALTLISFPLLYRWLGHSALSGTRGQVQVARALGANWRMIVFEVVWPQSAPQLLRASGLAALWASGDFAVSGIVATGGLHTLPLLMQDLIGNYRIEAAQILMFPLLVTGLGLYALFLGASRYVAR